MRKSLPGFAKNNNIYNFEQHTINGTSIEVFESNLEQQFKLPKGFKAWCHPCSRGFKSIEELNSHVRDDHRIFKG